MGILGGNDGNQRAAEDFWKDTEAEIGEAVAAYGLAQYLSGGDEEGPLWGLIYLTETRLFFRHFAQTSWFHGLMSTSSGTTPERRKPPKERDVTFAWPLTQFTGIATQPAQRGWQRLFFGNKTSPVTLERAPISADAAPAPEPLVFTVENNRTAFLAALKRALGSTSKR